MQVILIVFISLLVVALLSLICILFVRKIKATDKDKKRRIIGKRRNRKYVDFVNEHSLAIRAIKGAVTKSTLRKQHLLEAKRSKKSQKTAQGI